MPFEVPARLTLALNWECSFDRTGAAEGGQITKEPNVKTGTVMDLEGGKEGEGVKIIGFEAKGTSNQKWELGPGDGVNVTIRNAAISAYAGYPTFNQGAVLQSSSKPQNFSITLADNGFYISPPEKPDHVVDLSGAGQANGTEICLWIKHGGDHQKWRFEAA
ncbi:ricin-type beta-trefoil lectin domain-containing protein [Rhizoctonia solani AG-1 IA]|uniref:Ricin-type beta-trefoil lectin domain-containing protein n=1 Tax=Thanatephorus cucumeris (strain AG1-IA) TaxID=983506 RepID=L8WJP7_THACA|nr:ricin-type beta-trefoil lectin domain-containing protein [Rhizoctonia solani AG-1 IA]